MKNRNVKVVDQNNIDRDANVVFAIDLEGSEYVVYWVERDDDENNLFVSKLYKLYFSSLVTLAYIVPLCSYK